MSEAPSSVAAVNIGDDRFLDHLASAADMVGARRFREAEVEVLRALSIAPSDLRALKLLGLVRFKLGRLEEARAVCREIAATLPRDAGIRLKLGLIALKLDRIDESVQELEMAARLAPDDLRTWSYLGFAHARRGERARAAAAFRRAGQDALAAEAEAGGAALDGGYGALPAVPMLVPPSGVVGVPAPDSVFDPSVPDRSPPKPRTAGGDLPVSPLVGYVVSRLASTTEAAPGVGSTARLAIGDEAFVRGDAAVACTGTARWEHAHRHVRGRSTAERLYGYRDGDELPFFRLQGRGDLFVGSASGPLVPLQLTDDVLYLRQDCVVAFEGTVAWECGHVPRGGMRMLQFRGRGLVAMSAEAEPGAIKVTPERPVFVSSAHLLGWVGRVVARGTDGPGTRSGIASQRRSRRFPFGITCEGEGVVLVDVKGQGRQ